MVDRPKNSKNFDYFFVRVEQVWVKKRDNILNDNDEKVRPLDESLFDLFKTFVLFTELVLVHIYSIIVFFQIRIN